MIGAAVPPGATTRDPREAALRRGAATHHDPEVRTVLARLADRVAQSPRTEPVALAGADQRRALLVSAAVLMDEAHRLLDRGGSSAAAMWLKHAMECVDNHLNASG